MPKAPSQRGLSSECETGGVSSGAPERARKKARRAGGLWERISSQHFEGRIFHPQGIVQQAGDRKAAIGGDPGRVKGVEIALGQVFRVGSGRDARHAHPVAVGAAGGNVGVVHLVPAGNSFRRSYLFTTPNFLIV